MKIDLLPAKFQDLLVQIPFCACWVYDGPRLSRNLYGRVWYRGRERQVHIVVYELLVGPIPDGLVLDHTCRVRLCANPAHLEPVTVRENTLRGAAVLFGGVNRCLHGRGGAVQGVYRSATKAA